MLDLSLPLRKPLSTPSEAQAAPLAAEDLEGIYRAHWRRLHGIARRMVGPIEADAVVQEVFVALLRDEVRTRFGGGDLAAWLAEITRRKALQHLDRVQRGERPVAWIERGGPSPEDDLQARDLVRRFMSRHVPEEQRHFFELRFLERRTQVDCAAALGTPRSTLEGWEHKLTKALRAFVLGGK
jgi:RNA polymerase sigma factor (sigma-70 family)